MNALDEKTVKEISLAMELIEANEQIRVIIFTGAGEKAFASGADINELTNLKPIDVIKLKKMNELYKRIENCNKATIAAMNGYALGGGLELALACDIRIASENVKLGFPELSLGIIPGSGGTQRLTRLVGKGMALDLILTGEMILANEAKQLGLVSKVVLQKDLLTEAKEKARRIIEKGPLAVQLAKLAIHKGNELDLDSGLLVEQFIQAVLYSTKDKEEGMKAFLEKRTAIFTGE